MTKLLKIDWSLSFLVLLLLIIGLTMQVSVAPHLWRQQLLFAIFGIILFLIFAQIDTQVWQKLANWLFGASVVFLATPFLFGTITRGALRWLQVGPFTLQPSELTKPLLVIFLASFFANNKKFSTKRFLTGGLFLALPLFLIFSQPDLGSSLVVFFTWVGFVLAVGAPWRLLVLGLAVLVIFVPFGWGWFLKDYQKQRIIGFLAPNADPLGTGYHLIQTKVAVGSGQLFGRGWGRGTQSHLEFLPERHTDFIFASLCEELGFLGATGLVGIFAFLFWRILLTARGVDNYFGFLLCLGFFSLLFTQVIINLGMNLGLLPITGIPLPLISYGGSSLVATMICLGLVANVSVARRPHLY